MAFYRQDKINEEVSRHMTEILRSVKDPRVSGVFISITGVEVSRDMSVGKIFYSVLGENDSKAVSKGIESASGFIRSELASRLNLRMTPKLVFIADDSAEKAMNISKILKEIDNEKSID